MISHLAMTSCQANPIADLEGGHWRESAGRPVRLCRPIATGNEPSDQHGAYRQPTGRATRFNAELGCQRVAVQACLSEQPPSTGRQHSGCPKAPPHRPGPAPTDSSRISLAEQPSSTAAAALNDKKLLKTNIAAAVGCSDWFGAIAAQARSFLVLAVAGARPQRSPHEAPLG